MPFAPWPNFDFARVFFYIRLQTIKQPNMDQIIDSAKEKLNDLSAQVSGLFKKEIVDTVKEYGVEKINEIWGAVESSTGIFLQCGYTVTAIDVSLGLPPSVQLSFDQIENISDESEAQILEENKDKTFLYPILLALFKANALQKSIHSTQYKFTGLNIGLGITPAIDMKFTRI
jgi:hypothetical protein